MVSLLWNTLTVIACILLCLLTAGGSVASKGSVVLLDVEVRGVNVTSCTGSGLFERTSYEVAVLHFSFDSVVKLARGKANCTDAKPKLSSLQECQHAFGSVGFLELLGTPKVWPLTYPKSMDELLPRNSSARYVPLLMPICRYEDETLDTFMAQLGFPPVEFTDTGSSHILSAVLLTGFRRGNASGAHAEWRTFVSISSLANTKMTLHLGPSHTRMDPSSSAPFSTYTALTNATGEFIRQAFAVKMRGQKLQPTVAQVYACSDCFRDELARAAEQHLKAPPSTSVARFQKPSSFKEAQVFLQETLDLGIPFAKKVLAPVCAPVLKSTVNVVLDETSAHVLEPATQIAAHEADVLVPPHVVTMLLETVPYNVTNVMQDSLADSISTALIGSLGDVAQEYLVLHVPEALAPRLDASLSINLHAGIAPRMDSGISNTVQRSLLWKLLHSLTRTLTHAVVASVSGSLSPTNANVEKYCRNCYYYNQHCSMCQFSSSSQYYLSYHAAYFSDYYANYYAEYYGNAIEQVDTAMYGGGQNGLVNANSGVMNHDGIKTV